MVYNQDGNHERAIKHSKIAISIYEKKGLNLHPNLAIAYITLADSYALISKNDKAVKSIKKGLSIFADDIFYIQAAGKSYCIPFYGTFAIIEIHQSEKKAILRTLSGMLPRSFRLRKVTNIKGMHLRILVKPAIDSG